MQSFEQAHLTHRTPKVSKITRPEQGAPHTSSDKVILACSDHNNLKASTSYRHARSTGNHWLMLLRPWMSHLSLFMQIAEDANGYEPSRALHVSCFSSAQTLVQFICATRKSRQWLWLQCYSRHRTPCSDQFPLLLLQGPAEQAMKPFCWLAPTL